MKTRTMVFEEKQNFSVGGTLRNMRHWCDDDGQYLDTDLNGTYTYIFECEFLDGEKIDYDRITEDDDYQEECYDRGINADCASESEIYVDSAAEFEITEMGELEDWSEEYGTLTFIQRLKVLQRLSD